MKGSGRTSYEAGTKLLYNSKKLYITNDLQFSMVNSDESPYGDFSSYTQALPYHREKDADGKYYRTLSLANVAPEGMSLSILAQQESPVYEAKYLNSFTEKENYNVTNNTSINWEVFSDLRVRANFSVSYDFNRTDGFISPRVSPISTATITLQRLPAYFTIGGNTHSVTIPLSVIKATS